MTYLYLGQGALCNTPGHLVTSILLIIFTRTDMPEEYKSRVYKQMQRLFIFTLGLLISLGFYTLYTNKAVGGITYGRFGGMYNVSYGGYGFFAALIAGSAIIVHLTPQAVE